MANRGCLQRSRKISPQLVKLSDRLAAVLEIILPEHIGPKAAPPGGLLRLWRRSCPEQAIDEQQLSGVYGWNSGSEAAAGQGPKWRLLSQTDSSTPSAFS